MTDPKMICPKCRGEMQPGFIPDFRYGTTLVSAWYEGYPKTYTLPFLGIKVSPRGGVPIRAFRCSGCGFLELFADENFRVE